MSMKMSMTYVSYVSLYVSYFICHVSYVICVYENVYDICHTYVIDLDICHIMWH